MSREMELIDAAALADTVQARFTAEIADVIVRMIADAPRITVRIAPERKPKDTDEDADLMERIRETYNAVCPELPKAEKLTDARRSLLRARIADARSAGADPMKVMRDLFAHVGRSALLSGQKKRADGSTWRADFDWLLTARNFPRVLSGTYDDYAGKPRESSFDTDEFFAAAIAASYGERKG